MYIFTQIYYPFLVFIFSLYPQYLSVWLHLIFNFLLRILFFLLVYLHSSSNDDDTESIGWCGNWTKCYIGMHLWSISKVD